MPSSPATKTLSLLPVPEETSSLPPITETVVPCSTEIEVPVIEIPAPAEYSI